LPDAVVDFPPPEFALKKRSLSLCSLAGLASLALHSPGWAKFVLFGLKIKIYFEFEDCMLLAHTDEFSLSSYANSGYGAELIP
jgi:hypothetical protein